MKVDWMVSLKVDMTVGRSGMLMVGMSVASLAPLRVGEMVVMLVFVLVV